MKDKFNLVGTQISEFSLANSQGATTNIREFKGKKNAIIILFRSKS
jgi:peroxiredoxin